jgi:hypothetical protein
MSAFGGKAGSQRGAAISSTHANIIQRPVATAAAWNRARRAQSQRSSFSPLAAPHSLAKVVRGASSRGCPT